MAKQSLGIFKCRIDIRDSVPGERYTVHVGWKEVNVEVFVDPQALATEYGPRAHASRGSKSRQTNGAVEIVALKIKEFKS